MNIIKCFAITTLTLIPLIAYAYFGKEYLVLPFKRAYVPHVWQIPLVLAPKTLGILEDLIQCESGGNEHATNPKDLDGTASYGLLQFKPATLLAAIRQFNLRPDVEDKEIGNLMFDGQLQIDAFIAMYGEGKPIKWWQQQFPGCSKKFNYWQ